MKFTATIDRIEEHIAVLEIPAGEATLMMPVHLLPAGATDGDHLVITILVDEAATEAAEAAAGRLQKNLEAR